MATELFQVLLDGKPLPLAARLRREPQELADGTWTDKNNAESIAVMLDHRRVELRSNKPRRRV